MLTVREAAAAVRELRDERGWTQADLASRARVSRSFVADLEGGMPSVDAGKLFEVFQAVGFLVAFRDYTTGEQRP